MTGGNAKSRIGAKSAKYLGLVDHIESTGSNEPGRIGTNV